MGGHQVDCPPSQNPYTVPKTTKAQQNTLRPWKKYITKELDKKAVMGPYQKIPFQHTSTVGISPLSTRPKKDFSERRVILDLSFPMGTSSQ